ncbi:MAG: lipoprotein insertase outer membrane protein LolB [Acidobacteriota bacterium]
MRTRIPLAVAWSLALTACQTTPFKPPLVPPVLQDRQAPSQQWQGHFSVKLGPWGTQSSEGQSFTFYLQTQGRSGELSLMTPLGTQLAQVIWTPEGTRIESSQGTQQYASLHDLSTQLLGEDVPLQALPHWLQGLPSPDLPSAVLLADHTGFEQASWTIDAHALPQGKLQALREQTATQRQITIKVRLER